MYFRWFEYSSSVFKFLFSRNITFHIVFSFLFFFFSQMKYMIFISWKKMYDLFCYNSWIYSFFCVCFLYVISPYIFVISHFCWYYRYNGLLKRCLFVCWYYLWIIVSFWWWTEGIVVFDFSRSKCSQISGSLNLVLMIKIMLGILSSFWNQLLKKKEE